MAHCFKLNKKELIYKKHILIVDDLITTGSTIESCSKALLDGCVKSLSLAAIAITSSMFRQN